MRPNRYKLTKLKEDSLVEWIISMDSRGAAPILFLALFMLFSIVIVAKFIFGEWGTALNIGCFFLVLVSALCAYTQHLSRLNCLDKE
jgi:hypothetical protein